MCAASPIAKRRSKRVWAMLETVCRPSLRLGNGNFGGYRSFAQCNDNETYNNCWKTCKQSTGDSNYQNVVHCYEQMCYIFGGRLQIMLVLLFGLLAVLL